MFHISVIIPMILMVMTVVYYNVRFIDTKKDIRMFYILFESIMVIGFSYLLFFFGFITTNVEVIILLLLLASVGIILFVVTQHQYDNFYHHWKVIGNALLAFLKIGLPFYLFLTIFRYQPLWLQLLLAIGLTTVLNVLYVLIHKHIIRAVAHLNHYIFDETHYEVLYVPIIVIALLILLFNLPVNSINDTLNTESHFRYLDFYEELPYDVSVDYEDQLILQFEPTTTSGNLLDVYLDESTLYVLDTVGIKVYNRDTLELEQEQQIIISSTAIPDGFVETQPTHFVVIDDDMLVLTYNGLYKIMSDSITKLSDITSITTDFAVLGDNNIIFFEQTDTTISSYGYSGTLDLISTYDLSTFDNVDMGVFGTTLYIDLDGSYYIADDEFNLLSAQTNDNAPIDTALYLETDNQRYYSNDFIELDNSFYQVTSDYNIRIYNDDFELTGFHRINRLDRWFILRSFSRTQSTVFRTIDNDLYYLVSSHSEYETVHSLYTIQYIEPDWNLPFYPHYSFTTLLFVLVGVLIPYWNTETNYTYVDFVSITKQKKDEA